MRTFDSRLSRRDFISAAAAAPILQTALSAARRVPVAVELYSVRQDCQRDLPGTLAVLAKMGYEGFELAGFQGAIGDMNAVYGRNPKELRQVFDDSGLKMFSIHLLLPTLVGDQLERTVEANQILGNSRLTLGWLNPLKTIQPFYEHARQFNEIAERLGKHKMQFAFHNHAGELDVIEGKRPLDVLMDNTGKDVGLQIHVAAFPGKDLDPVAYIKRYPGRVRMFHLNDYAAGKRGVMLGEGVVDWKGLFSAAETVGGVEVYIVEQESYPEGVTPVQSVERCLQSFRKLHA
ncbi:MAG: sugar phosphate isomerase/epimerase [Acidobacteriia bacterium]|nr:sugar phosphate isomerase/epimerase [Terriglobia bacterium]